MITVTYWAPKAPWPRLNRAFGCGKLWGFDLSLRRTIEMNSETAAPPRKKRKKARKKAGHKKAAQAQGALKDAPKLGEAPTGERAAQEILGANPLLGFDRKELLGAIRRMTELMAVRPDRFLREELKMLGELGRVLTGGSTIEPDRSDRRFKHEIWKRNPFYRRVMQGFLAWRKSLFDILEASPADEADKERARYALSIFTEAMAPTNSLIGNPGALARIVETRGMSLVKGARNLLDDIVNNGGMPKQVDETKFAVGKNLACTPGAVVFRNEVCEILQYIPVTEKVYRRPALVIPPQINKFYVVDLAPGRSFAEYATQQGLQLFTISWRNPTLAQRDWNLETYLEACKTAIDVVCNIAGTKDLNVIAACAGGYTLATLLGHLAAIDNRKVKSATYLVTVLDTSQKTMFSMFSSKSAITAAIRRSRSKGILDGREMARAFAWLRPNDLIYLFVANNWVMGNDPPAFDILYWNADSTRLSGDFHADLLSLYLHNPLVSPGKLKALGTPIDLSKVNIDSFVLAGITDHITPWKACYQTLSVLGGKKEFVLSSSGHIQSIVNPPGNPKAKFFMNQEQPDNAEEWFDGATENAGSWWDYWFEWIRERSGAQRKAPETPGSETWPAGDKAPGRYVHQR